MENFDLKKYLVENKMTRLSEETMDAKSIVDKIKAGNIDDLENMPGNIDLAADIIKLLSKDKEALKQAKAELKEINEETLQEGNLKNLVLGALMAVSSMAAGSNVPPTSDISDVLTQAGIEQADISSEEFNSAEVKSLEGTKIDTQKPLLSKNGERMFKKWKNIDQHGETLIYHVTDQDGGKWEVLGRFVNDVEFYFDEVNKI